MMQRNLTLVLLALLFTSFNYEASAEPRIPSTQVIYQSSSSLKDQVKKLTEALNKRDLEVIKAQIAPSRIYVEVSDRAGAYLSNSQTLVVMETFLRSRTAVNAVFEFVSDDGVIGSASGTLTARKDGRIIRYKLNFGFVKQQKGNWHLNRISMR